MFEKFYLAEKTIHLQGEQITLRKYNLADRAIISPIVGQIIHVAAQEELRKHQVASTLPGAEKETPEPEESPSIPEYDLEEARRVNEDWIAKIVFMIGRGVKGFDFDTARNLVENVEEDIVQALLTELVKFNYIEASPVKKKLSMGS